MAFPKKVTRRLKHYNSVYLWHLKKDWDIKNRWIVVAKENFENGQLLFIDPYHHDFIPTPKNLIQAIEFALAYGWDPLVKSEALKITFTNEGFKKVEGLD